MAWSYVWAVTFAGKRGGRLFIPAVLMLGVIPDIDLLLGSFGVKHHTFTHSLFFWFAIFLPFLVFFRRKAIPYLLAVVQHFAFGDFFVADVMLLWPFTSSYFGFNTASVFVLDVALEIGGLFLAAGMMYLNGDLKRLLSIDVRNSLMSIPLLALLTSMLYYAIDWPIIPLVAYVWSSPLLTIIVLAHMVLSILLALSTVQGLRRIFSIRI